MPYGIAHDQHHPRDGLESTRQIIENRKQDLTLEWDP